MIGGLKLKLITIEILFQVCMKLLEQLILQDIKILKPCALMFPLLMYVCVASFVCLHVL